MKSIIEQFYYGEVLPCELPAPTSKKYKETQGFLKQTEEEIISRFPEVRHMLAEYKDVLHSLSVMESTNEFVRGFRYGARFMIDTILNSEEK